NMMRFDLLEVETMQYMCQGLLRLMAGLKLAGALPEPPVPPFNSLAQRFDQRFASFSSLVRPPALLHSDYVASMDPGDREAGHLLSLAAMSFRE
ncbi:hypothetical protein TSOC_009863, partial [Tetrabaena socialis]